MPPVAVATATAAYAGIKTRAAAAGVFDRSYAFYFALITFAFAGYAASVAAIVFLENAALITLACLAFAFFSVQVAGLMHDSGHRAVFSSITNNDILGYLAAGLLGMVFDNWKTRHNMHHAHPNEEDADPDLEIPFIATSEEMYLKKGNIQRWLARYQALYYYPLGAIVSFSNRLGTVTYFLRNPLRGNAWKAVVYALGLLFLFAAPFAVFPLGKALLVFFTVHVSTGIYLANCFAPNHKGMPLVARGQKLSFLEQQVITARNVKGGVLTDTLLVGLNHQIEHHLFPYTPRNKLDRLKPYVVAACRELGIEFTEVGLLETNRILLRELGQVARNARVPVIGLSPATLD